MNELKPCVIAYVPPPRLPYSKAFLNNMQRHQTKYPLILFTDSDYQGMLRIGMSPEMVRDKRDNKGEINKFAINNLIFFTAIRIAIAQGFSHMLYAEADSRVMGKHWDDRMYDEFFSNPNPALIGGSMVCYNPCNTDRAAMIAWEEALRSNTRKNFPIPTYGWKSAADDTGSCVFVNGSLGIYNVPLLKYLFDLDDTIAMAAQCTAWDMEIGHRLWKYCGADSYKIIAHLQSVYSSYGEVITTESERIEMLRSGAVVGIHQVKSQIEI